MKKILINPLFAILIGLLPSAMLLLLFAGSKQGGSPFGVFNNSLNNIVVFIFTVSIFCCFIASFLLFTRREFLAILAGILLLFLNICIAFFSGCLATIGR